MTRSWSGPAAPDRPPLCSSPARATCAGGPVQVPERHHVHALHLAVRVCPAEALGIAGEGGVDGLPAGDALTRLRMLDLGHNELTSLPEALGNLTGLSGYLYLSHNRLTSVPKSLGNLVNLAYLNITDNKLTSLEA